MFLARVGNKFFIPSLHQWATTGANTDTVLLRQKKNTKERQNTKKRGKNDFIHQLKCIFFSSCGFNFYAEQALIYNFIFFINRMYARR